MNFPKLVLEKFIIFGMNTTINNEVNKKIRYHTVEG